MKAIHLFISLFILTNVCSGQEIFDYEKKISNLENYNLTELEFLNTKDDVKLSGTLITPKAEYDKIIILVPGTGMDTRHNHYLLTEHLLLNHIAVFRYDERGTGKSTGKFSTANYTITDMSNDLSVIFSTLKNNSDLTDKKIGLVGHSQGGMVTMTLIETGLRPDFLIQWATSVQKHGEFIKYQLKNGNNTFENELILDTQEKKLAVMDIFHKAFGGTSTENDWKVDYEITKKALKEAKKIGYTSKNYTRFHYANFAATKHLLKKNFEDYYKNISIPTLYIIGSEDTFVDPKSETALLKSFHNDNIKISIFENLNHYLTKGDLSINTMYEIDDVAKNEITNWIKSQ